MGRKASGGEFLERAKVRLSKARTIDELRQAQAVVLPLEFGLSLEKTAQAIGVSVGWACQLRTRFVRSGGVPEGDHAREDGHRREHMTHDEEAAFLAPFFEKAKVDGFLVVSEIKQAMDARLGRKVALASAYNLLHRHGWSKQTPDKRHPKAKVVMQNERSTKSPISKRQSNADGPVIGRSG